MVELPLIPVAQGGALAWEAEAQRLPFLYSNHGESLGRTPSDFIAPTLQCSEVAETLYETGQINALVRIELISAIVGVKQPQSKAGVKVKMRDIDRYMGGGKGSPVAQGGLPSMGKRRP